MIEDLDEDHHRWRLTKLLWQARAERRGGSESEDLLLRSLLRCESMSATMFEP
ncbi:MULTISPECIES: hypothetical protein [unclassified Variovorax]|uniref:hypothetical protein n=1 Tax=unclassified Variovorax TaxID=663243 RepID=UPI0012EDED63|nr:MULTISPECIES: hypothetical protein [unclassified Variovorax]